MADADDYLQEGFDPRNVTVPRLRSILVTHNVDYPGTAKKPQLVELVNEYILPQVPKLRAQRAKAKRSSMGIVNAGSAEDNGNWDDHDLEPPRTASRRSASPRKAARYKREESEVAPTPARSTRRQTSSRPASRAASHFEEQRAREPEPVPRFEPPQSLRRTRASEEPRSREPEKRVTALEPVPRFEPPPSARRTRASMTPQIKQEYSDSESESERGVENHKFGAHAVIPSYEDEPSVFTDDNPFQSGSSPIPARTPTTPRRAYTADTRDASVRTDRTVRQRTTSSTDRTHARNTYTPRVTKTPRHKSPEFLFDPGEEFTPEAQLELEEAAARGEVEAVSRPGPKPPRKTSLKVPFLVLFITLLGAYSAWFRQEKIAVGYCGLGRPAIRVIPPEIPIPDFLLPLVEPQCDSCPMHAYCYQGYTARCHNDFVLKSHPLSLGGLIPLPPTCEPDGEKARRVQAVAQRAIEELRQRRAKFECGQLFDEAGQRAASPAIAEDELKKSVSLLRNRRLNNAEFEDLWTAAIGEITTRDEIIVEVDETATATPRSVRLGLARYRFPIGLLITLVFGASYARARYRQHLAASAQVPSLVDVVLERLANQKELGEEGLDDPWLFLPNLRDDVLRSVHSLKERERIWQRVRVVVELNSNVRTSQRESRNGEVGRAWEWIGPVKGDGARRRREGRPWNAAAAAVEREATPAMTLESKEAAAPVAAEPRQDIIKKKMPFY
ncbi:Inner nuclear membrane protein SRC1 [Escovopsis weberi]|uniref:Inner nuclear membrane protein SRC1 n=1 Tax=Escovopsis weberi TaxID=150374 RepID=A0A0M9VTW3_ESCWE|nr:Inner nuclear membrane protein SRC1 [Escovopsis weberi]